MNYSKLTIGERITTARRKPFNGNPGYSQGALAVALGLDSTSRTTIRKWERGEVLPPLEHLLKMCALFGCELGYLLGEQDLPTRTATDIQQETGLSRDAIEQLRYYKSVADGEIPPPTPFEEQYSSDYLKMVSMLVRHERFFFLVTNMLRYAELYNSSTKFILNKEDGTTVSVYDMTSELEKMGWTIVSNHQAADYWLNSSIVDLRTIALDIWKGPEGYK